MQHRAELGKKGRNYTFQLRPELWLLIKQLFLLLRDQAANSNDHLNLF